MGVADEIAAAGGELRRLIGTEDLGDDTVIDVFANEELVRDAASSPRDTSELQDFFNGAPRQAPRTPEAIRGALAAFWRWAGAGFGVVDAITRTRRIEACLRCEDYVEAPQEILYSAAATVVRETKVCSRCGCFIEKKVRLSSETCPRNAWPAMRRS